MLDSNVSSIDAPTATTADTMMAGFAPSNRPRQRPLGRRVMHLIRRTHLFLGLLLLPWAILYGVTGFLFNHPTILADSPAVTFNLSDTRDTPLENLPSPWELANDVLKELNAQQQPSTPYRLSEGEVRYGTREAFFMNAKSDQRTFFITFNPNSVSGIIRESTPKRRASEVAPFATRKTEPSKPQSAGIAETSLSDSVLARIKAAIPIIMQRSGLPAGEVTILGAPDLKFPVEADGKIWAATYNLLTKSVAGTRGLERSTLSWRTFLLRMHLTHEYPEAMNAKWVWAIFVDAIAFTLCFWGISGILMWRQIKATRNSGLIVLAISASIATILTIAMYQLLTA